MRLARSFPGARGLLRGHGAQIALQGGDAAVPGTCDVGKGSVL